MKLEVNDTIEVFIKDSQHSNTLGSEPAVSRFIGTFTVTGSTSMKAETKDREFYYNLFEVKKINRK